MHKFFNSLNTPVPIAHIKSFEVFYRMQQAGYQPIEDGIENQDITSSGIIRHAVGVAMHGMQKFGGMDTLDPNTSEMSILSGKMMAFKDQYKAQCEREKPIPLGLHR